ncbi:MAG: elongation factor P [Chlamydiota bacterium]
MAQVGTNEFKTGLKLEIDGQPFLMVGNEFVKPGKGQAFNRTKLKNMITGRVVERTYKSGEKVELADIEENSMRMLYKDSDGVVFMDDQSYDQVTIPYDSIGSTERWLMEDLLYDIIFYKGEAISVEPPTFMDLKITETAPGVRGDTASGRVMKPAVVETGTEIQVPIFIQEGEVVKVDTRTGEYVSRSTE